MKKIILTLAVLACTIAGYAQQDAKPRREELRARMDRLDKLSPEQKAEKAALALQKRLNLSEDQRQKVQAIELERAKKNMEWRAQDEKSFKNKMEERKIFMKASKEKMDQILTEEQRKKLEETKIEAKEKIRNGRDDRPGRPRKTPPPPAKN